MTDQELRRQRDLLLDLLRELDIREVSDDNEELDYEAGSYLACYGFCDRVQEALRGIYD
jgi:hypothetical protein